MSHEWGQPPFSPRHERGTVMLDDHVTLVNVAFRMLGSMHDAEDIVQDAYARWYALSDEARQAIRSPTAWLVRVTCRICLDQLTSARARRERYVGDWLPEPLPDDARWASTASTRTGDPAERVTIDDSVSMGMLVMLESVTPAERVVFVLHDVFNLPHTEIADIVRRTPEACRQLGASARRHLQSDRRRAVDVRQHRDIVTAFRNACEHGDFDTLISLLDPNVSVRIDGGGKARAARRPILGSAKTARYFLGLLRRKFVQEITEENVNGLPGLVSHVKGEINGVMAMAVRDGLITDIWLIANPDKLHAWQDSAR
ncbi:RNA polymerase sigma-70 factor, ECF subfamily [Nonomuraea maritima]|uniref:RNA polymerase sigma-70 factor, ECF subfamily n=1 Tax=Nonomuraea maritima TaxID=683260 RepID=A0A1G9F324_9ACTN|nr:RNA polymerase sigma factor SigJ [Nonomuraea maritima]SDK82695.1 RNA polymerase sigma-70 factor, ECF subfamily [Nonomuraea maritima]